MKSFSSLLDEVQSQGLCHRCGGCVSFCSAINYGALEMGPDGYPRYKDEEKCIQCGLCYMICPETEDLEEETRARLNWAEPMGNFKDLYVARARDSLVRDLGTDGGVVTAILLHLMESGRIDSAIVSRQTGPFGRQPFLATSKADLLASAGSTYDESPGGSALGDIYSTYSASTMNLAQLKKSKLSSVAFVGVPDQIMTMRKMETLGIIPSHIIKYYFGLFCSKHFQFGKSERNRLERMGDFRWNDLAKLNIKEQFQIRLKNGREILLPLDELDFMARHACRYCTDYSAEFADISFGGLGAPDGWTTVLVRTDQGRGVYELTRGKALEEMEAEKMRPLRATALELVQRFSEAKRARGMMMQQERLGTAPAAGGVA